MQTGQNKTERYNKRFVQYRRVMYKKIQGRVCLPSIAETGKGKAIPLQAWTGPEGSKRLRLPDFKKIRT